MLESWGASEGIAHRELEPFLLVAPGGDAVALLGIQRHAIAESEEPERRQPLHRDADRALHALPAGEAVVGGSDVVRTVELDLVTGVVDAAHVEESAHAGGLRILGRHGEDQLVLAGEAQVTAVGVAELIPRSEKALAEATHVVGAAAEEV